MKEEILIKINEIEEQENIKVIFLIESGSRAWGWESKDSDYDVRGVFVQDYDRFEEEKKQVDLIEGEIDIVLWDLKKFFRLFVKSNPSVWEWLSSDIIYLDNDYFHELRKIFQNSFSNHKLEKHYLSMAKQNFDKYIDSFSEVNLKKYVYVIRSITCINFIEEKKLPPPKNYRDIISYLPKNICNFFQKLINNKINSEEIKGARDSKVDAYICSFWDKKFQEDEDKFNIKGLEEIFKKILQENKHEN